MSGRRLDVKQAAEVLGISSEGVRKRIKRGSLVSEKDQNGKVWVWLDEDRTWSDVDWTGSDAHPNGGGTGGRTGSDAVLTEALRDQVTMLQSELKDWKRVVTTRDEELRRKDHIIAALTERIPELESPREEAPEPPGSPEKAFEGLDNGKTSAPAQEQQEPSQRRSWVYRFFFGPE